MMPLNQMHIFQKNVEVDDMALMLKPLCFFSLSTLMIKREDRRSIFHFPPSPSFLSVLCVRGNVYMKIGRQLLDIYGGDIFQYLSSIRLWFRCEVARLVEAGDLSKYNRVIFTHEENSDRRPQRILNKIGSKYSKSQSLTFRVSICIVNFYIF